MAYTDEQIRGWIRQTLPGKESSTLDSTPMETLYALYGDICKYGPNGSNFVEAQEDLAEALKTVSPDGRVMHELTSSAMLAQFEDPASYYVNDEVNVIVETISSNWDSQHFFLISIWLNFVASDGFRSEDEVIAAAQAKVSPLFDKACDIFGLDSQKYRWVDPA